jgi:hypothetical protein
MPSVNTSQHITTSTQGRLQHFSGAKLHKIY